MSGKRRSDTEVEVLVHVHPDPHVPPVWAIAIAMRESDAWCHHVDEVRRAYSQRIAGGRSQ